MAERLTIAEVNRLDPDDALTPLGGLFEDSPHLVAQALEQRPFATRDALYDALCDTLDGIDWTQRIALIQAHPDLAGRAALAGTLGRESTAEQHAAGLAADALTPEEIARIGELNARYRERFGFPFVICARDNGKAGILAALAERLEHDRETEIATAIGEIRRIAWHRLDALIREDGAGHDEERR